MNHVDFEPGAGAPVETTQIGFRGSSRIAHIPPTSARLLCPVTCVGPDGDRTSTRTVPSNLMLLRPEQPANGDVSPCA
jgi:hypothetical protein